MGKIREKTATGYRDLVRLHVVPHLGHIPLVRLSPPAIEALYTVLVKQRGLSTSTVSQIAAILSAALNSAVKTGLVMQNPCAATEPPSPASYDPVVLSPEQIGHYLDDVDRTALPPLRALYYTAIGGGCRLGELLGVRETDVEFPFLHIHRTLRHAGPAPTTGRPKTDRGIRTIWLPQAAVDAIRAALVWKKQQKLRMGPKFRDAGLLICGARGRPINPSNLRNRDHLPRLVRLGLPRCRPHDLRHANGTHLTAAGVDPRTLADRLGHSRPSFTMERYSHASAAGQERAAEVANDLLTKRGQSGR
jgi:integrase